MHNRSQALLLRFLSSTSDIFLEIRDINSSIFGICAFRFTVISFTFMESSAIFIDLSFFTVITAGLTKQFLVISVAFSTYPCFIKNFSSCATWSCRCIAIGRPFCCIICAPVFIFILTERVFISLLL